MGPRVVVFAIGSALVACGHPAPARPVGAAASKVEPTPSSPSADDACLTACADRYAAPPDADLYAGYCLARCAPVDEPNPTCADACRSSHEPGAYLDDEGEYQTRDDPRDADQRAADDLACDQECAHVPMIDGGLLTACVDACVADGDNEPSCQADCDPDPYDVCRYQPCD